MRSVLIILCIIFGFPGNSPSQVDPVDELSHYYFHVYSDKDGLPQNTIRAVITDPYGYLWVGTQDGVARYNGHQWSVFDLPDKPASNFVNQNAICAASDGSVWFGTRGAGIAIRKNDQWTVVNSRNGLPDDRVNFILEAKNDSGDSEMWIATYGGGIAKLSRGQWIHYGNKEGLPDLKIFALAQIRDLNGNSIIWAGHMSGLSFFRNNRWQSLPVQHPLNKETVYHFTKSSDGHREILWAATSDGVWTWESDTWKPVPGSPRNLMLTSLTIGYDHQGKPVLWVGTLGRGLFRYSDGRWFQYHTGNGLKDDYIFSLHTMQHSGGDPLIWIGTANAGLHRFKPSQWRLLDIQSGLPHNSVVAAMATTDGDGHPVYWIGTNGGLWRYQNGRAVIYDNRILPSNRVLSLFETRENNQSVIWCGTDNGLMQFRNNRWFRYPLPFGLTDVWIYSFAEEKYERESSFWLGTAAGLLRFHKGKWKLFGREDGLPSLIIHCLLPTPERLWIGTEQGLCYYQNGRVSVLSEKDGVPHPQIFSLCKDPRSGDGDILWVGTAGGAGKLTVRNESFSWEYLNETSDPPLPDNRIHSITGDSYGRLYFGTNKGIARITPADSSAGAATKWFVETYTGEDGLPSKECNGRQGMADPPGRIWIGTVKGVVVFEPEPLRPRDTAVVRIEFLMANQKYFTGSDITILQHDQNHVGFAFSLFSFFREPETVYRTFLKGLDVTTGEWTRHNRTDYRNLPSGDYVFMVWGKDYTGKVTKPAELRFSVMRAPWWSWWAWAGYAVLSGLIFYGLMRIRLKWLYRKNVQLEKLVNSRTKELRQTQAQLIHSEKMSAIGQMVAGIAHEINNPVAFILSNLEYIRQYHKKGADSHNSREISPDQDILEAVHSSESGVKRIRDIVWNLIKFSNLNESEKQTLYLEETVRRTVDLFIAPESKTEIQILIEPDITLSGNPTEISLVLRNILLNSVHAVQDAVREKRIGDRDGLIRISAFRDDRQIRIHVEDNGSGIPAQFMNKIFDPFFTTKDVGRGRGLGLTEVYAIIRKHGGTIDVRSEVGKGSEFIIRFPAD